MDPDTSQGLTGRCHSSSPAGRRLIVWILATSLALAVAATTKIGPIVLTLTPNHGVHLGDVIAFVLSYVAAAVITVRLPADRAVTTPTRRSTCRMELPSTRPTSSRPSPDVEGSPPCAASPSGTAA
jgi:hypothetical protein